MPEQFGEKQHAPTEHRRQQARDQGQVPRSQDLSSAVMLLGAIGILQYSGGAVVRASVSFCRHQLEQSAWLSTSNEDVVALWYGVIVFFGGAILPIFGMMFLVALLINLAQVGFLFLPNKLALDASRLNVLKGLQRIFSLPNTVRLGFGIFKVGVVATVAVVAIWNQGSAIQDLTAQPISEIAVYLVELLLGTCLKVGFALLILAILDFAYQKWKHEQDLRMTTQEMRDEMKQLQGDPQVAARRKAVQRQLVMNRMSAAVPTADAVITNPTELAIAIRYDHEEMDAPVVVAKGAGTAAQRIRRLALENGVPVVERKELARALFKRTEIGKPIPPDQYAAMAEVLRYVYELQGKTLPELDAA
jgi:flagellar biosynthetic protein FlhB